MKEASNIRESGRKAELAEIISQTRKKRGLTQEELAELTHLTVRTIQRIENGKTTPRSYTLKTIISVLNISLDDLQVSHCDVPDLDIFTTTMNGGKAKYNLRLVFLSCFCYLVLPFVHFVVPHYLLSRMKGLPPEVLAYAREVVRGQIYWLLALHLILLLTVTCNFLCVSYLHRSYYLHYLIPALGMYFVNAIVISRALLKLKRLTNSI
jgi:transcriptional regulator with XRE-family HTH domain